MDYIFSVVNPRIEPVYFVIAVIIAILTSIITKYYCYQGRMTRAQSIGAVFLIAYIFLVFASTVFSRTTMLDYSYELIPFWSYQKILKGEKSLFWEDIFNVILLIPMGIFLPIALTRGAENDRRKRRRLFRRVTFIGFFFSLTIELLQLITKRGLFEFDDIFHNTLGTVIGCWLCWKMRKRIIWIE